MPLNKLGSGSLIFVPGIMGTELRFRGRDSKGVKRDDLVWGEDFGATLMALTRRPELLASPDLVATTVIREIRFGNFNMRKVYGPLLDFCTSQPGLALTEGQSFFTFPYDWRLDLTKTAMLLATLVQRAPTPVFIVTHSMGGLVTRILLNLSASAAERFRGVFEIACPVGGSSKAFTTLRVRPSLGPVVNWLWPFLFRLKHDMRARFMNAVGNMASIYQLLPQEKILCQSGGCQRAALDAFWGPRDQCMVQAAQNAHDHLATVPAIPIQSAYSPQLATEWLLNVDEYWNVVGSGQKAQGDGTITSASAVGKSTDNVAFHGSRAEHTRLCSRTDVHEALRTFLS